MESLKVDLVSLSHLRQGFSATLQARQAEALILELHPLNNYLRVQETVIYLFPPTIKGNTQHSYGHNEAHSDSTPSHVSHTYYHTMQLYPMDRKYKVQQHY